MGTASASERTGSPSFGPWTPQFRAVDPQTAQDRRCFAPVLAKSVAAGVRPLPRGYASASVSADVPGAGSPFEVLDAT
jgi:hypothetical protein